MDRVDRQLRVIGKEAQRKLSQSSILLIGLGGLGVEIAKNLILTGFQKVGIHDRKIASYYDLSTQFFLSESSIGKKTRLEESINQLRSLNDQCEILDVSNSEINEKLISSFNVLITTETVCSSTLIQYNNICRKHGVYFISSSCHGLVARIFCDFGETFLCTDQTGEKEVSGVISKVEISENGDCVIDTLDPDNTIRPDLQNNDVIRISGISGIPELENCERPIRKQSAFRFEIGKIKIIPKNLESIQGGRYVQVKQPKIINFHPISEFLSSEESINESSSSLKKKPVKYLDYDYSKIEYPSLLHQGFKSLSKFLFNYNRFPYPYNSEDSKIYLNYVKQDFAKTERILTKEEEEFFMKLSFTCSGNFNPLVTFIGGFVAQEAQKSVTSKFHPIEQFLYFECFNMLQKDIIQTISNLKRDEIEKEYCFNPNYHSEQHLRRYESQILIFGKSFQKKLSNLKIFLIGCGALGCEYIKNFAMTGICCCGGGGGGSSSSSNQTSSSSENSKKLVVTDMDEIEISNLSRQFLFRREHIGKMKSICASESVKLMNSQLNIIPYTDRVGPSNETEVFHDRFFESLDFCVTALDNLPARRYIDSQCVFFKKPLFDSGTLGTKCHTQVVLPKITINYNSQEDIEQNEFPECSIHVHPNIIQHTISWGKRLMFQKFNNSGIEGNLFLKQPNKYLESDKGSNSLMIENLYDLFILEKPKSYKDCILWARKLYDELFIFNILSLLRNHPKDERTESGGLFWTGTKRCPSPLLSFDFRECMTRDFIVSAARLKCEFYKLEYPSNLYSSSNHGFNKELEYIEEILKEYKEHELELLITPLSNINNRRVEEEAKKMVDEEFEGEVIIEKNEDKLIDEKVMQKIEEEEIENKRILMEKWKKELLEFVKNEEIFVKQQLSIQEFEKDDDLHIKFVTSCSNLRARNYKINEIDAYETKGIAGSIVPAMITTTALATGLMMMEILKYVNLDGNGNPTNLNCYSNGWINIGLPLIYLATPKICEKTILNDYTVWDRCLIQKRGDISVKEFMSIIELKYGVEVVSIAYKNLIIFLPSNDSKKDLEFLENTGIKSYTEMLLGEKFHKNKVYIRFTVSVKFEGNVLKQFLPVAFSVKESKANSRRLKKKRKKKISTKKIIKT